MNSALFRRVLVVDDELNIVSAVRRELSTPPLGRYRYEVEGFSDPAQALERARSQSFDVVISDYRMPGMSGLEFLKALAALQPECARLVLSGQTDMDGLVKMVNETHIYRFIPKPWHDYFLKSSVAQAIEFNLALQENRRLAGLVREREIAVPPLLADEVDHILIVDDEASILSSLSRVLSNRTRADDLFAAIRSELSSQGAAVLEEDKNKVLVTTSAQQALKMAEATNFSCILADFKMPEMSGVDLLQRFAEKQPDCARILISGKLTQDDLIDAVDAAHIFGFVAKPWQDYELKACVAQALAHRRMVLENRILADMVRKAGGEAA
ncbi:MAG: response regulator [Rhodocyclaceae bacterium]|nr:response regulator [Rhodocyclaceae bacterium]